MWELGQQLNQTSVKIGSSVHELTPRWAFPHDPTCSLPHLPECRVERRLLPPQTTSLHCPHHPHNPHQLHLHHSHTLLQVSGSLEIAPFSMYMALAFHLHIKSELSPSFSPWHQCKTCMCITHCSTGHQASNSPALPGVDHSGRRGDLPQAASNQAAGSSIPSQYPQEQIDGVKNALLIRKFFDLRVLLYPWNVCLFVSTTLWKVNGQSPFFSCSIELKN